MCFANIFHLAGLFYDVSTERKNRIYLKFYIHSTKSRRVIWLKNICQNEYWSEWMGRWGDTDKSLGYWTNHLIMPQLIEERALYCGKLGYAAKIGRRKDPDAGDRIAAREQPEVDEVGKIRYTSSPLLPVQRPRFIASVSFTVRPVCLTRLKVANSTLL